MKKIIFIFFILFISYILSAHEYILLAYKYRIQKGDTHATQMIPCPDNSMVTGKASGLRTVLQYNRSFDQSNY